MVLLFATIIVINHHFNAVRSQSDCEGHNCIAECNNVYTGFYEPGISVYLSLTLTEMKKVTFTNCGSIDVHDTFLKLYDSSSTHITEESDNECVGYGGCVDTNYPCDDDNAETFTFSYLAADTYEIKFHASSQYQFGQYQIQIFCGEPGSRATFAASGPIAACEIANLSVIRTIAVPEYIGGQYPGHMLLGKGFNIFTAKTSGSPVLDSHRIQNLTDTYFTQVPLCTYSALEFNSKFSFYSLFAKSHSESIEADYSTDGFAAGGSLSTTNAETRSHASSGQYYIHSMRLDCVTATASVVEYNQIYWNVRFLNALRTLPTHYETGDSLEEYTDFWNKYGTHLFETAHFGGSIHGSVVSNKCSVDKSFGSSKEYETCLNAEYKGVTVDACESESDVSSSIENTYIEVKGGPIETYQSVFDQFGDKETDFLCWKKHLTNFPDIVGGNIDPIHVAIRKAIKLGSHRLNEGLSFSNESHQMSNNEWLVIADHLESAYKDHARELLHKYNYFEKDECDIECHGYDSDATECVCIACESVAECCGSAYRTTITHLPVLLLSLYI